jgi:hypothetical protein
LCEASLDYNLPRITSSGHGLVLYLNGFTLLVALIIIQSGKGEALWTLSDRLKRLGMLLIGYLDFVWTAELLLLLVVFVIFIAKFLQITRGRRIKTTTIIYWLDKIHGRMLLTIESHNVRGI